MGTGVFLGCQPRPHPKGAGPQRSLTLRVPFYLCVHRLMQNYQIGGVGNEFILGGQRRPVPKGRSTTVRSTVILTV